MNAYVQASLEHRDAHKTGISSLKAVVSFMYFFQVVAYSVLGTTIGKLADGTNDFQGTLMYTCGVQFTIVGGMSFLATFVPRGSWAINPKAIGMSLDVQREELEAEARKAERGEQGEQGDEEEFSEDDPRRSFSSPVILALDTIPRTLPSTIG